MGLHQRERIRVRALQLGERVRRESPKSACFGDEFARTESIRLALLFVAHFRPDPLLRSTFRLGRATDIPAHKSADCTGNRQTSSRDHAFPPRPCLLRTRTRALTHDSLASPG